MGIFGDPHARVLTLTWRSKEACGTCGRVQRGWYDRKSRRVRDLACGVISDITGVGPRILRDIVAGRTDPHALAQHRDHRCQASGAQITAALTGHYRPGHVFVLQQNLELFDTYHRQLAACDAAIEAHVQTPAAQAPAPAGSLPAPWTKEEATRQ